MLGVFKVPAVSKVIEVETEKKERETRNQEAWVKTLTHTLCLYQTDDSMICCLV